MRREFLTIQTILTITYAKGKREKIKNCEGLISHSLCQKVYKVTKNAKELRRILSKHIRITFAKCLEPFPKTPVPSQKPVFRRPIFTFLRSRVDWSPLLQKAPIILIA